MLKTFPNAAAEGLRLIKDSPGIFRNAINAKRFSLSSQMSKHFLIETKDKIGNGKGAKNQFPLLTFSGLVGTFGTIFHE